MGARFLLAAAAVAASAALAAPPAPAAQKAAAVQRDWTRTVVATPEGGFRMGNPNARVKLVEYGALSCPHCADFARASKAALMGNYVRSGRVSFEFRTFILNGADTAATLVSRCAGAPGFFATADALFAAQDRWLAPIRALSAAQRTAIEALPAARQMTRYATIAGLFSYAGRAGVTPQRARACLASRPALDQLLEINRRAAQLGINSTPTFLINGARNYAWDWESLEPLIRQAGG